MADKKRVRRSIKQLQRFKTWQLVIVLIFMLVLSATFLRLNNIGMIERRNAVAAADASGSPDTIHDRLYDLQRYASAHMNASPGEIYLTELYKRDAQAAIKKSGNTNAPNQDAHKKAATVCDKQFSYYSSAYVQCFVSELNKYPGASQSVSQVSLPKTDLYRYEFYSPAWSPDFAGFSILISLLIVLVIIGRLISLAILRILLRRHYSSI